jgi:CHAT domain-containing protein
MRLRRFPLKSRCAVFRAGFHLAVMLAFGISVISPSFAQQNAAAALDRRATELEKMGKYSEAISLAQRALALREKELGPNHRDVARSLNDLAVLYLRRLRYADAEPLYKRSLAISEKTLGPDHPNVAVVLSGLANIYQAEGHYADAEPLYKRLLAIREKTLGLDHPDVAQSLNSLASLYEQQGRYADAELLYKRSLAIGENALGADHADISRSLNGLAGVYRDQGRYDDAEPLFKRSLAITEKRFGPDDTHVAGLLSNLANLYWSQGRESEIEPLFKRAVAIDEKTLGPEHPDVAYSLLSLADLYAYQGRYADAEPLYKRVLAIWERTRGPDHPDVARSLRNLANLYRDQGRYADVEPLYKRSLAILQKALGGDHPDVARLLRDLGNLYRYQGRYADAQTLIKQSLAIREKALGANHPSVALALEDLANLYRAQNRFADALPATERLIAIGRARPDVALPVLYGAQREGLIAAQHAMDDSLDVVQRVNQTSASAAVGKLAVRLASGNDRLAQLVRKDQDLAGEAETLEKSILAELSKEPSKRDAAGEQKIRERLAVVAKERTTLQETFASEFPDYVALSKPLPISTASLQSLLSDDEVLVAFAAGEDKTSFVFALTRERFDWKEIPLGTDELSQKVTAFRVGLNVDQIDRPNGGSSAARLFDLGLANELYLSLFGPVEALVSDKKQLLVVPSGSLTALPFHLLVTEKPAVSIPENLVDYRNAAWLIKRQAVAVLPSIASLKALRALALKNQASKPLVGFGDPIFNPAAGSVGQSRATAKIAARSLNTRSYTEYWQGAAIDRSKLAQDLPQLPDTAVELKSIAQKVGARESDIHLGKDANETVVKRAPLSDYRIVYFATHALVAGDVKGVAEPSIVLSIPSQPSDLDDGLLTASEVAQLKLNADWVVLSACNTIAGDKPGAEALSGLARSFFYAGARALLVSHWAVESEAAARLTASTFEFLKSDPKLGRAEALRQAMLSYLNDQSSPQKAYPAFWGPFTIVGEVATR